MIQHFLIEGHYLGSAPRTIISDGARGFGWPLSKLFYCAECGDVFAKCPTEPQTGWRAVYACCAKCPPKSGLHIPGSIWDYEPEFVAAFPDAVLQQEAKRHLQWFEKEQEK